MLRAVLVQLLQVVLLSCLPEVLLFEALLYNRFRLRLLRKKLQTASVLFLLRRVTVRLPDLLLLPLLLVLRGPR